MADIPTKELDALRFAFESALRDTFGVTNIKRTTEGGYDVAAVQMAWFACRCGWLTGNTAPSPASAGSAIDGAGAMGVERGS